jgi:hypothetical protein
MTVAEGVNSVVTLLGLAAPHVPATRAGPEVERAPALLAGLGTGPGKVVG